MDSIIYFLLSPVILTWYAMKSCIFFLNHCSMPINLTSAQFLFFPRIMFTKAPKQCKPLGTNKLKILLPISKNRKALLVMAAISTLTVVSHHRLKPKYSCAAQGYMWISSPSWIRICNWRGLFLLPWEWYFLPYEDLFFHVPKSSNLSNEADDWSLISANDCLLMLQANRRLQWCETKKFLTVSHACACVWKHQACML